MGREGRGEEERGREGEGRGERKGGRGERKGGRGERRGREGERGEERKGGREEGREEGRGGERGDRGGEGERRGRKILKLLCTGYSITCAYMCNHLSPHLVIESSLHLLGFPGYFPGFVLFETIEYQLHPLNTLVNKTLMYLMCIVQCNV